MIINDLVSYFSLYGAQQKKYEENGPKSPEQFLHLMNKHNFFEDVLSETPGPDLSELV